LLLAVGTGFLNIRQTRPAAVPNVAATGSGVRASGGQAPAFDIETGSVSVGAAQRNVTVPNLRVEPAGQDNQAVPANQAAPAPAR